MIKKYLIKTRAVAVACVLAMTTVMTACGTATTDTTAVESTADENETADAEEEIENSDGSDKLEETMTSSVGTSQYDDTDKEETVYVISDANGDNTKVTVSEWLKNKSGDAELVDTTMLNDIENVKGNETYTVNDDGTITWETEGEDIYYKGTTTEELPVSVKVSYKLDGKDIAAEDLAGKSGHVTIRFDYTNNSVQTVEINGEDADIYTPFAMISGMILPTDKFSNVTVSNGKVISDANDLIVVGMGLPGLADSLNLDKDKLEELSIDTDGVEIPEYFEVECDTSDFELGMTMTMATSDVLSMLGMTDVNNSDSIDEVNDKIDEVSDGVNQLSDGASALKDGTKTLYDGTKDLSDGAATLRDGITDYTDGVQSAADGTATLNDGLFTLKDGVSSLWSGSIQLSDGIHSARNGAAQIEDQLSASISSAKTSVGYIDQAIQVLSGIESAYGTEHSGYSVFTANQILSAYPAYQTMIAQLQKSATEKATQAATDAYKQGVADALAGKVQSPSGAKKAVFDELDEDDDNETNGLTDSTETAGGSADTNTAGSNPAGYEGAGSSVDTNNNTDSNADSDSSTNDTPNADPDESSSDTTGTTEEAANPDTTKSDVTDNIYGTYSIQNADGTVEEYTVTNVMTLHDETGDGSGTSDGTEDSTAAMQAQLKGLISQVQGGTKQVLLQSASESDLNTLLSGTTGQGLDVWLSTYDKEAFDTAIAQLRVMKSTSQTTISGLQKLQNEGIVPLREGLDTLDAGGESLTSGVYTMANGVVQLSDGSQELKDGMDELTSNSSKLKDGASDLYDGTETLQDGAKQLDNGAGQLTDGIAKFDEEGVSKIQDAVNGDLKSFSERLQAVSDAAESYTTYGGASDDQKTTVKFFYKTAGIKA